MSINNRFLFFLFIVLFVLLHPLYIFPQSSGRESEEDDYIYDIVEPRTLEIDADFYLEKYTYGSDSAGKRGKVGIQADLKYYNAPTLTLRYGVIKNLEFQLVTGYAGIITNGTANVKTKKNILISANNNESGFSGLGLGFKAGLLTNKNVRPSIALSGIFTIPSTGNKSFTPNNLGVDLGLNFYNLISEEIDIAYSLGAVWSGYDDDPNVAFVYGISPGYTFSDYFGLYLDFNGINQKGYSSDNRFDVDLSFTLNDYLYLDVYAGTSFNVKKFFFVGSTFSAIVPF